MFDTLMGEFFKTLILKNSADDKEKSMKNYPVGKEFKLFQEIQSPSFVANQALSLCLLMSSADNIWKKKMDPDQA